MRPEASIHPLMVVVMVPPSRSCHSQDRGMLRTAHVATMAS